VKLPEDDLIFLAAAAIFDRSKFDAEQIHKSEFEAEFSYALGIARDLREHQEIERRAFSKAAKHFAKPTMKSVAH
jgi:hypothetical protein